MSPMPESLGLSKMEPMVVPPSEALVNVTAPAGPTKGKLRMVVVKERKPGPPDGLENSFL